MFAIGRSSMTHTLRLTAVFFAALVAVSAQAQQSPVTKTDVDVAPGRANIVQSTRASALVVAVDPAGRSVSLKAAGGRVFDVIASPEVRNFEQIRVGDTVKVEYMEALSLVLKKNVPGAASITEEEIGGARSPEGAKPGGAVGRRMTFLANVVSVDAKRQVVVLRGPKGNTVDLRVPDREQLKNIKQGDQVQAVYTEAVAIAVETVPAAAK